MRGVFPGRPQPELRAVDTALWDGIRIVTYISGDSLVILRGPHDLLQTISHGEETILSGVAADARSGKLATTDGQNVYVYQPIGREYGDLRWTLQTIYHPEEKADAVSCLSWGLPGELLVSSSRLALLTTDGSLQTIWQSKRLANAIKLGLFSHDASLIASTGDHDRLAKIWRRGFIGGGNERFDPVYIRHPATVTDMRWREGQPGDETGENENLDPLLYTTCADGKLRVWSANDMHCLQILQLWAEIDMFTAIQPREPLSPGAGHKRRYATVINHWDFQNATEECSRQSTSDERRLHTKKLLSEVAERKPETVCIFDNEGNMSAWGLERVGCKARHPNDVINMANAEAVQLKFEQQLGLPEDYARILAFCDGPRLQILAHYFDGRLSWYRATIDRALDPSPEPSALTLCAELTGHSSPVERLFTEGAMTLTSAHGGEVIVWQNVNDTLVRQSSGRLDGFVDDCMFLDSANLLVVLTSNTITVMDSTASHLKQCCRYTIPEGSLQDIQFLRPSNRQGETVTTLTLINKSLERKTIELTHSAGNALIRESKKAAHSNGTSNGSISKPDRPKPDRLQPLSNGSVFCYRVDGSVSTMRFKSDVHAEFRVDPEAALHILPSKQDLIWSSLYYVACFDPESGLLRIFNRMTGHLEHEHSCDKHDPPKALLWMPQTSSDGVLAAISGHKVVVLVCAEHSSVQGFASWICVKEVSITNHTNMLVSGATWISPRCILIAAGQQMFLLDMSADLQPQRASLLDVSKEKTKSQALGSIAISLTHTLPTYHPIFLEALGLSGHFEQLDWIIGQLISKGKYFAPGDTLESSFPLLGSYHMQPEADARLSEKSSKSLDLGSDAEVDFHNSITYTQDEHERLLESVGILPWLSDTDRNQLRELLTVVQTARNQAQSTDNFGRYFLSTLGSVSAPTRSEGDIPWPAVFAASQSKSQDILMDQTIKRFDNRLLWTNARSSGIFLWLSDTEALQQHLETVARAEYMKTEERNPVDCALLYLALRKKAVLTNLWRLASWHKEQRMTHRMLQNDFSDPRWKTAASKNAYALMGKRRTEYAAAWFLLADDLRAAVSLLSSQCNDLPLAITVARAYEGDHGPVLRELVLEKVLPTAAEQDNRWMAAWAFWLLGEKKNMLRAFTDSFSSLIPSAPPVALAYRKMPFDEPALGAMYQRARAALASDPREAPATRGLSVAAEHALVRRCAHMYIRMGLGPLALDLLRKFQFSKHVPVSRPLTDGTNETNAPAEAQSKPVPSALDAFFADDSARASAATTSSPIASSTTNAAQRKVAVAPSEASILDDFDF